MLLAMSNAKKKHKGAGCLPLCEVWAVHVKSSKAVIKQSLWLDGEGKICCSQLTTQAAYTSWQSDKSNCDLYLKMVLL